MALKIAKIIAAQSSAQPFKNNSGASAIASKIVLRRQRYRKLAAHLPTSGFKCCKDIIEITLQSLNQDFI